MDVDQSNVTILTNFQILGGFVLVRKTFRSLQFFSMWNTYCQDYRIIGNEKSVFGLENHRFRAPRNDQSILTLLKIKFNLNDEILPDPSQWGEVGRGAELRKLKRFEKINKTFINLTRDKS